MAPTHVHFLEVRLFHEPLLGEDPRLSTAPLLLDFETAQPGIGRPPGLCDMKIVQITPGAAGMYCGGCMKDNALVAAMRRQGHDVLMVPLYTPLTLDETDQTQGIPVFFGGVNVYLEQKFSFLRRMPDSIRKLLSSPGLLRFVSSFAAKTSPSDLGDLTISMLQGEHGYQAAELETLAHWLKQSEKPDVICLSNILLSGLTNGLRSVLGVPVVSYLQGEDFFLDGLPEQHRQEAWRLASQRARELDALIAPSRFFADTMARRLGLPQPGPHVVLNGIRMDDFHPAEQASPAPILGYFARMTPEKGLGLVVDVFLTMRRDPRFSQLRLKLGGSCTGGDVAFVKQIKARLEQASALSHVEFHPNVDRAGKIEFLRSLTVFCTPALYGEAFGLYVIEAMACGVPVVVPNVAAFPDLISMSGGGLLTGSSPQELAQGIGELLLDPQRARAIGLAGHRNVLERFSIERMARETVHVLSRVLEHRRSAGRP